MQCDKTTLWLNLFIDFMKLALRNIIENGFTTNLMDVDDNWNTTFLLLICITIIIIHRNIVNCRQHKKFQYFKEKITFIYFLFSCISDTWCCTFPFNFTHRIVIIGINLFRPTFFYCEYNWRCLVTSYFILSYIFCVSICQVEDYN